MGCQRRAAHCGAHRDGPLVLKQLREAGQLAAQSHAQREAFTTRLAKLATHRESAVGRGAAEHKPLDQRRSRSPEVALSQCRRRRLAVLPCTLVRRSQPPLDAVHTQLVLDQPLQCQDEATLGFVVLGWDDTIQRKAAREGEAQPVDGTDAREQRGDAHTDHSRAREAERRERLQLLEPRGGEATGREHREWLANLDKKPKPGGERYRGGPSRRRGPQVEEPPQRQHEHRVREHEHEQRQVKAQVELPEQPACTRRQLAVDLEEHEAHQRTRRREGEREQLSRQRARRMKDNQREKNSPEHIQREGHTDEVAQEDGWCRGENDRREARERVRPIRKPPLRPRGRAR